MILDPHAAVEVHSVDTNGRVILNSQIDVLANAKAEVAGLGEVLFPQLVFFDLKTALENFLGFWASDCNMDSDLFISSDTK